MSAHMYAGANTTGRAAADTAFYIAAVKSHQRKRWRRRRYVVQLLLMMLIAVLAVQRFYLSYHTRYYICTTLLFDNVL